MGVSDLIAKSYEESVTSKIHSKKHPLILEASKDHHNDDRQFRDGFGKFIPFTKLMLEDRKLLNNIKFPSIDLPTKLFKVDTRETIDTKNIVGNISYAAISYVWQKKNFFKNKIKKMTGITWNIYSVSQSGLDRIFSQVSSLGFNYLWMDVLCIDQSLKIESKMNEAAQMHLYYGNASTCIVYLESPNQDKQIDLDDLKTLPVWFTRVWTVQEAWIPIQCLYVIDTKEGNTRYFTDYHFFHFLNSVTESLKSDEKKQLDVALNILRGSWIPTPLNIKNQINYRSSFDERDKILGVLGLHNMFAMTLGIDTPGSNFADRRILINHKTLYDVDIAFSQLLSGEALTWWLMCGFFSKSSIFKTRFAFCYNFGKDTPSWQILKSDTMPSDDSGCILYTTKTKFINGDCEEILLNDAFFASGVATGPSKRNGTKISNAIVLVLRTIGKRNWSVKVNESCATQIDVQGHKNENEYTKTMIRAAIVEKYIKKDGYYYITEPS
ncbi:hypothetical protein HK096_005289, partial [Nowakowskiella sp. JEL0078]